MTFGHGDGSPGDVRLLAPRRSGLMMGTPNERTIVDEGAVSPDRLGKVVPLRVAAQPPPPLEQLGEPACVIAAGMPAPPSGGPAGAVPRTLGREPFAEGEAPGDEPARPA